MCSYHRTQSVEKLLDRVLSRLESLKARQGKLDLEVIVRTKQVPWPWQQAGFDNQYLTVNHALTSPGCSIVAVVARDEQDVCTLRMPHSILHIGGYSSP